MQAIKTCADELATVGKPLDHEDFIEKILEGLDDEYQPIIDVVNDRETLISFDELHEKLINKELSLRQKISSSPLSTSANPTNTRSAPGQNNNCSKRSSWPSSLHRPTIGYPTTNQDERLPPRPFLGHCQWCNTQGHMVSKCPIFRQQHQTCNHTSSFR